MAQRVAFETPNKTISYVSLAAGILSIIAAVITLLASTPVLSAVVPRTIVWWIAFVLLVISVVVGIISTTKKIGSSAITYRAEMCGIIAAVILVISTFVAVFFK
ncbi:MAG TPA: hypothetical protein O0X97_04740 [Methanocorpusculum sp.]|nr:hypothetical protein [Methanocorpusculum sp.]